MNAETWYMQQPIVKSAEYFCCYVFNKRICNQHALPEASTRTSTGSMPNDEFMYHIKNGSRSEKDFGWVMMPKL